MAANTRSKTKVVAPPPPPVPRVFRGIALTTFQEGQIAGMRQAGLSFGQIAKGLKLTKSTVHKAIVRLRKQGENEKTERRGRPALLTSRDVRSIKRYVHKFPRATYREIRQALSLAVCDRTIRRCLQEEGIRKWIAKRRPLLKPPDAAKRLSWCRARRNWTVEQWRRVIFSDECAIQVGSGARPQWVFRTSKDKWDPRKVHPKPRGRSLSIMVWAAINFSGKSRLIVMERDDDSGKGGFSSRSYQDALEEGLLPFIRNGDTFMQDNAPIHRARATLDWLSAHRIEVLDWPPYSPDLNPIENVWSALKWKLTRTNRPEIPPGTAEEVRATLKAAIWSAWDDLSADLIEEIADSMKKRVECVIKNEGWYTPY